MVVPITALSRAARAAVALTVLGFAAGGAAADDEPARPAEIAPAAVPPEGSMVVFEAAGEKIKAYLARADGKGLRPAVVVIHEWWGLNDQIKGVADRLAGAGFDALVPDFYRGKVAKDRGLAHDLSRGLNETRAVEIIEGAALWLRSMEGEKGRPVATVGFCMGGRLSLATALRGADVQATVMFYGSVETDRERLAGIRAPVLGIFGADDRGIPVDEVRKFEGLLKELGKTVTVIVYSGVGHAFFNEQSASHDPEMAKDAWHRMKDFLTLHLRPGSRRGGR